MIFFLFRTNLQQELSQLLTLKDFLLLYLFLRNWHQITYIQVIFHQDFLANFFYIVRS